MVGVSERRSGVRRLALSTASGMVLLLALVACTSAPSPEEPPTPSSSASASPAPTEAPDPELVPAGDAEANLPYFDFVNRRLLETVPTPNGQQIVENLVAAGFAKADMEVTPDVTVGAEAAETIQFSVRANGTCLIGQTGAAGYNALAAPLLGTGKCLVGKTRTIDF
jgi:hypothetical protein